MKTKTNKFSKFLVFIFLGCIISKAVFPKISEAQNKVLIRGKVEGGEGYTVVLMSNKDKGISRKIGASGSFSFKRVSGKLIKKATLQLLDPNGAYFGPIVLARNVRKSFAYTAFKQPKRKRIALGTISLKSGYGILKRLRKKFVLKTIRALADSSGKPVGAGKNGLVLTSQSSLVHGKKRRKRDNKILNTANLKNSGGDSDSDGIPNGLDLDDDGDLNLDITDPQAENSSAQYSPFTTLFLTMPNTLNVNLGNVTQTAIDAVIGGETFFNIVFYLSMPPELSITGAHIICHSSNPYCRSSNDGGGTAVYMGVNGSDLSIIGTKWSNYNADGSGYPNLEPLSGAQNAWVASVSPRVGTSQLTPGDTFIAEFMNGSKVVKTIVMSLPAYFVTVPAVKSYNAGDGEQTVDYNDSGSAGMNENNPIVLSSEGQLTLNFWRPQRLAIQGAEADGDYMDMGNLHYGLILNTDSSEFGCDGHYSQLSSSLIEDPSPSKESLWPLVDTSGDTAPESANTLSFTVNLSDCISENSASPGVYSASLTAAGVKFRGGANRAAQTIYISIP